MFWFMCVYIYIMVMTKDVLVHVYIYIYIIAVTKDVLVHVYIYIYNGDD